MPTLSNATQRRPSFARPTASESDGDVGRAHRVSQSVEAGMVWVNSENVRHLPTPFGGVKASGIGRDGGDYAFEIYMEQKNIAIGLDKHRAPKIGV